MSPEDDFERSSRENDRGILIMTYSYKNFILEKKIKCVTIMKITEDGQNPTWFAVHDNCKWKRLETK